MTTPQLRDNCALAWDYRLGLRGAGLIVYGALPASLSAFGLVKVPEQAAFALSIPSIPFIAVVALAPVVLTFVLTKQRMAAWYVLTDYLWLRSILNTLGIVVASTAVCLAARALVKPDICAATHEWLGFPLAKQVNTVGHALLLSLAFLVGSSTLFLTVIKEDGGLPLLPAKDRLTEEGALRKCLVETAAAARKWDTDSANELDTRSDELIDHITGAKKAIANLRELAPGLGRELFYTQIEEEVDTLGEAIGEFRRAPRAARAKYWANPPPPSLNQAETKRRTLMQRHAELDVHA